MLIAFRVLLCSLFLISGVFAEEYEEKFNQYLEAIKNQNEKIDTLRVKLKSKKLNLSDKKFFQKERDDLIFDNFKNQIEKRNEQRIARHEHARRNERIKLKYSPTGICKNPCDVNLEAVVSKKVQAQIGRYIFYVDDIAIESNTSKLATTIYFSKSMLTDKQKRLLSKNIPLHKIFNLRVEGIISETKMLESEIKKLIVKSLPSNLTSIDLITTKVLPYGKIQIATNGINATKLTGILNNIPINFEADPSLGNSQVFYALAPYLSAGTYNLSIFNFKLNIEIGQMPIVSNSSEYVNNISNNSVNLGSVITDSGRFNNLLGNDGIALFSKYNDVVVAFDNYIKNEATPTELQEIANIINAITLGDSNVYFFVKNDRDTIREFFNNINNAKILSRVVSIFIENSFAQSTGFGKLFNTFIEKVTEAIKTSMSIGLSTAIDGQINKCYISKGRSVPASIIKAEKYIVFAFGYAAKDVLTFKLRGGVSYYLAITAAQALIVTIGLDCEGDSRIIPKLVIQYQPIAPIIPGESIDFGVKCDVGDQRYYNPGSILTRVTSRFDYLSDELKETGDLIARDKLVHSCSGLGQDVIADSHNIHCNTNLLEETSYYQNNSNQYETINPTQCKGNDYYDVGTYLVSSPDFSCNFVNLENNVNITGKKAIANQLVFDLSKQMKCPPKPKAVINYTKNNLVVNFDSIDPEDPNASGLTYSWDFGDGATYTTPYSSIDHTYQAAGAYTVSMTVKDQHGASSTISTVVTLEEKEVSFFLHVNPQGTYYFVDTVGGLQPNGYFLQDKKITPTALNLSSLYNDPNINLRPGDFIKLQSVGAEDPGPGWDEAETNLAAVFRDSNGGFLYPGPQGEFYTIITPPTYPRGIQTDILQDFWIPQDHAEVLQVPQGAADIAFSVPDSYFADNSDPNGDYGVIIKITIVRSSLGPLF